MDFLMVRNVRTGEVEVIARMLTDFFTSVGDTIQMNNGTWLVLKELTLEVPK